MREVRDREGLASPFPFRLQAIANKSNPLLCEKTRRAPQNAPPAKRETSERTTPFKGNQEETRVERTSE